MKKRRMHYTLEEKVVILRQRTAEESPPASRVTDEADYLQLSGHPPAI
jgi:hypothetical protein